MGSVRLLLAISVVLYHAQGFFHWQMVGGTVAVETFFMISGFIMAMVLSRRYDPVRDRLLFYSNRMLRIYVPYFAAAGFALAVAALAWLQTGSGTFSVIAADRLTPATMLALVVTQVTILGQDIFLFFKLNGGALQWSGQPPGLNIVLLQLLPPAWSISIELLFYAAAPWLVRRSSAALLCMMIASLGLRLGMWQAGMPFDPWRYRFFPVEIVFFLAGILAYRLHPSRGRLGRADWLPGLMLIAAIFAYQPVADWFRYAGWPPAIVNWSFYACAVPGISSLFAATNRNRLDEALGDLSYAVYLVHWPVLVLLDTVHPNLEHNLRTAAAVGMSLVLAWVTAVAVEKPLARLRQRRVLANAASAAARSMAVGQNPAPLPDSRSHGLLSAWLVFWRAP